MDLSKKRMLGAMTNVSFQGLDKLIKKYNVETVLECGSGYSSYWFAERVKHLYTVDTNPNWFPKNVDNVTCIQVMHHGSDLAKIIEIRPGFDLILLDCYAPLRPKLFSFIKNHVNWKIFCIHDWGRDSKYYDKEYLKQFKRYDFGSLRIACKE